MLRCLLDIIFLRAWYAVQPRQFYNPVTSLLLANKMQWTGMRLTGQVRRDEGLKTPLDVNSTYKVGGICGSPPLTLLTLLNLRSMLSAPRAVSTPSKSHARFKQHSLMPPSRSLCVHNGSRLTFKSARS